MSRQPESSQSVEPGSEQEIALLRFGVFDLDLRRRELRKGGVRVRLQAQPFKLLVFLAGQPGRLVSREEVRRHLWGDDTYVDWEQGLHFAVRQVRQALDDSAAAPRYLETVPGQGYRFLAEVAAEPAGVPRSRPAGPGPRRRRLGLAVLGVLALVAAGWLLGRLEPRPGDRAPASPMGRANAAPQGLPRLAVLTFRNLGSAAGATDSLGAGLTEELIIHLTRLYGGRQIDVIAPASVSALARAGADGEAGLARMRADYLVEGSVQTGPAGVVVTARLLEAGGNRQLWAGSYGRRDVEDVLALRDELAQSIALALGLSLQAKGEARPAAAAARAYSAARRRIVESRSLPPAEARARLERARGSLAAAIRADPGFAPSYVQLARVTLVLDPAATAVPAAREHLSKALALDDHLADAHLELGNLLLTFDRDFAGAQRELERAVALGPGLAAAHYLLALLHTVRGHHDQALATARRALSLNPLAIDYATDVCWFAYFARRYPEAVAEARQALTLQPRETEPAYSCWVLAEMLHGDAAAAVEPARRLMATHGATAAELAGLDDPRPARALRAYWRWRQEGLRAAQPDRQLMERAAVHMALGEREAALAALERAAAQPDPLTLFLAVDPLFEPLHAEPRMRTLLDRIAAAK